MVKKITRSFLDTIILNASEFMDQNILSTNEACSFGMTDIELLIESEAFPSDVKIRHFDHTIQSDFIAPTWVVFPEYPFLLRLKYPLTGVVA